MIARASTSIWSACTESDGTLFWLTLGAVGADPCSEQAETKSRAAPAAARRPAVKRRSMGLPSKSDNESHNTSRANALPPDWRCLARRGIDVVWASRRHAEHEVERIPA